MSDSFFERREEKRERESKNWRRARAPREKKKGKRKKTERERELLLKTRVSLFFRLSFQFFTTLSFIEHLLSFRKRRERARNTLKVFANKRINTHTPAPQSHATPLQNFHLSVFLWKSSSHPSVRIHFSSSSSSFLLLLPSEGKRRRRHLVHAFVY